MKPTQRRHRPSRGRWPKLEKTLVAAFAECRKEGKTVRRKWFERTAKALFLQLYPDSEVTSPTAIAARRIVTVAATMKSFLAPT